MKICEDIQNNIFSYIENKHKFKDRSIEKIFIDTYKAKILNKVSENKIRPLWVGFKITPICNMKCEHCWADLKGKEYSLDNIKKALDKLSEIQILHLTLSGGEPFIRNDWEEIFSYAKEKRMCLEIFTNGSLINEDICKKLNKILDKNVDTIQISLDGSNKEYYLMQRKKDCFEKVINSIKLLKKFGFTVRVNFTATNLNQSDIFNTFKLCNILNVDTFSISHVYDLNKGKSLYDKVNFKEYLEEINLCIINASEFITDLKLFIPVEFFSLTATKVEKKELKIKDKNIFLNWFINSNGDIYPDVTLELDDFFIGNIYSNSLNDIYLKLENLSTKLLERNLSNVKCSHCSNALICKGGDSGRTYKEYKSFNMADPKCTFNQQ